MRLTDFDIYKELLREKSGMVLTPDKSYVLESRLGPIARKWGYNSTEGLTQALVAVPEKALVNDVIEAMSNTETAFFREMELFESLQETVLPYLIDTRTSAKKLRIWCAGSASGQEAYSLAIMLKEHFPQISGWKIEFLATDIAHEVLEYAKAARYSLFEVQRGMPIRLLLKYFQQADAIWKLRDDIRKMVDFKQLNLLDPIKNHGPFDLVLCCDVLADLDADARQLALDNIAAAMAKDAFLCTQISQDAETIDATFGPAGAPGLFAFKGGPHTDD